MLLLKSTRVWTESKDGDGSKSIHSEIWKNTIPMIWGWIPCKSMMNPPSPARNWTAGSLVVADFCWKNVAGATGKGKWLVLLGAGTWTSGPCFGVLGTMVLNIACGDYTCVIIFQVNLLQTCSRQRTGKLLNPDQSIYIKLYKSVQIHSSLPVNMAMNWGYPRLYGLVQACNSIEVKKQILSAMRHCMVCPLVISHMENHHDFHG